MSFTPTHFSHGYFLPANELTHCPWFLKVGTKRVAVRELVRKRIPKRNQSKMLSIEKAIRTNLHPHEADDGLDEHDPHFREALPGTIGVDKRRHAPDDQPA